MVRHAGGVTSLRHDERWNHNIHYHSYVLEAVPPRARTALDVGTGNGVLAAALHRRVPSVTGIDTDAQVLVSARAEDPGVNWVLGDVLTHPLVPASFDLVTSVATVHHLPDLPRTLARLGDLTARGGSLVIIGLARSSRPVDRAYDLAGAVQHRWYGRSRQMWEHTAPTVWPPPHTYTQVRKVAASVLPGSRWKRLPMWRYVIRWDKP